MAAATLAALAVSPGARAQEGWRFGPALEVSNKDAGFELRLAGYAQGDLRSRRNFTDGDDEEEGLNGTTTTLRRLRIGVEGEWKRLGFEATFDPADEGEHLKDLYAEVRVAKAFRVRGGHFKVPFSPEYLTSASRTDFIERALVVFNLAPSRDWGAMAFGEAGRLDYRVGVFEGDGRTSRFRGDRTVAGRVELKVHKTLDVGGSFTEGDVTAEPEAEGVEPVPRGLEGEGASGFRFSQTRFVQGRRRRLGADARWSAGPVALRGEWVRAREEREGQGAVFDDLPAEIAEGWVASATWLVTGEDKKRTIEPKRPLSKGGPGAIEVGARYESLRFDDAGDDTGFAGAGNRARNIRPTADRAFTGGLSWWPEKWARLMGNVVLERFEDALLAPEPGRRGQYVTILGRLQLMLP
jgi:phosphate-selective porin OprO/OprP